MNEIESVARAADILTERYLALHPREAVRDLEALAPSVASEILTRAPVRQAALLWPLFAVGSAAAIFVGMPEDRRIELLEALDRSDAVTLLGVMDSDDRERLIGQLGKDTAADIRMLLSYPPDTAGRLMDTDFFALHDSISVGNALEMLRNRRGSKISYIKLVDGQNRLTRLVDLRDLAFAAENATLADISLSVPQIVSPTDPRELVAEKFEDTDLQELPVIDSDGRVVGIIRHSRMVDALRDAASVDLQTMVGASPDERALSSSWFAIRKRMPWLQINLLTAFLAASVVGLFEGTIAKFTALAVLLPVVAGQSGNAGAQALAVTMRGLALREIRIQQWLRVTRKEINAGFWNGIAIAVTCSIGVYIWSGSLGLVIVLAVSMVISMVMAGIAGALVPITLSRLGQDPAVASSIILTTVTDVAGFLSFLGIATLLSGMLGPAV